MHTHTNCGGEIVFEPVTPPPGQPVDSISFVRMNCRKCGETSIINEDIDERTDPDICSGCGVELPEEYNLHCPRCT